MGKSKLLSKVRTEIRRHNYSYHLEQAYIGWMVRFVHFHDLKHPKNLKEPEVVEYLNHLVVNREAGASIQDQARNAIGFYYKHVMGKPLNKLKGLIIPMDSKCRY